MKVKKIFSTKILIPLTLIFIFAFSFLFNANISVSASSLEPVDIFSNFKSTSVLLLHKESGAALYSKNEHKKMQVASISKLMTTLITLEKIESGALSLDTELLVSDFAAGMEGSQAFLDAGSSYKVRDLLKSVIVASANDSAVVLAESISGSETAFVEVMNKKAKALKMNNTVYANATGLPALNQYSTAFDTAIILKEVSNYEIFNEDCKIWMDKLVHPSGRETELVNTNRLIKYYNGVYNGKTGFTDEAGYCLASSAEKNGMKLIAVTLGGTNAADRFKEGTQLYNYGFANYENKNIFEKNKVVDATISVSKGKDSVLNLVAADTFSVLAKKGEDSNLTLKYELNSKVSAPIKEGTVVGKCIVINNGVVVGEVNILASKTIEKENFGDVLNKIHDNWAFKF